MIYFTWRNIQMSIEFFNLCANNKLIEALTMYNKNIDLGYRDGGGRTPLAMAVGRGHVDIVRWLISIGSPLEIGDNDGRTALMRALNAGHLEVGSILMDSGANIDAIDNDNRSVLSNSIAAKQENAAIELIKREADLNSIDCFEKTALHHAVYYGMTEVVKLLIEKGCSPIKKDKFGNTPLAYALSSHNTSITTILENATKNFENNDFQDNTNTTEDENIDYIKNKLNTISTESNQAELECTYDIPDLIAAIKKNNLYMTKHFLEQTMDINQPIPYYDELKTPLEIALNSSNNKIIELIVDSNVDINKRFYDENNEYKNDYMTMAINCKNPFAIKLLIQKGFDITDIPYSNSQVYSNDYYLDKLIRSLSFNGNFEALRELIPIFIETNIIIDLPALEKLKYYDIKQIGVDVCKQIVRKCHAINDVNISGRSILHEALMNYRNTYANCKNPVLPNENNPDLLIDILLENEDIDVNLMDYSDFSPLYYACKYTTSRIVEKLLLMGTNTDTLCGENSQSIAYIACKENKLDILQLLIEFGVSINMADDKGLSPLHVACNPLNADLVKLLIDSDANVNCTDNDGNSPLHLLVEEFKPQVLPVINLLLENGADINAVNHSLRTPFFTSSIATDSQFKCRNLPILKDLISKGAIIDTQDISQNTPLHYAILDDDMQRVQLLLQHGCDANIENEDGENSYSIAIKKNRRAIISMIEKSSVSITMDGDDMDAAFMRACKNGQRGVAEMLVRSGNIDITYVDDAGRTPLHYISRLGMTSLAKFCIDSGVAINYTDVNNQTALHFAASSYQKEVFKLLIQNGADASIADNNGVLPIHLITNRGQHDMLKLLLDSGFSADVKMNDGATLLHAACYTRGVECVRVILETGIDPNILDKAGETPLIIAARLNQKEIARILIKSGANIRLRDIDGDEALHIATIRGFKDMIKLLLELGADVNSLNNRGLSPLHIAAYHGYKDIFKFLLEAGADFDIKTGAGLSCIDIVSENGQKELIELIGIMQKRRQTLAR